MRRLFSLALFFAFFAVAPLTSATAASASEARAYVDAVAKKALAVIEDKKLPKEKKKAKLQSLFSDNVDIPWVARFVTGRYWKQASPEQQKRYMEEYNRFVTANYAGRFADYSGGSYTLTRAEEAGDGEYTVTMEMKPQEGNQKVVVDYRLHTVGGALKIFDVAVEGVSLITTQRSEFAEVLGSGGMDELIRQMASRTGQAGAEEKGKGGKAEAKKS